MRELIEEREEQVVQEMALVIETPPDSLLLFESGDKLYLQFAKGGRVKNVSEQNKKLKEYEFTVTSAGGSRENVVRMRLSKGPKK